MKGSWDTPDGGIDLTGISREFRRGDRLYHIEADHTSVNARLRNLSSPLNHEYVISWKIRSSPPATRISISENDDQESQVVLGFRHPEIGSNHGQTLVNEIHDMLGRTTDGSSDVKEAFRLVIRRTRDTYESEADRKRIDILFGRST